MEEGREWRRAGKKREARGSEEAGEGRKQGGRKDI